MNTKKTVITALFFSLVATLFSQGQSQAITTAVPFLRVMPDARAGAMGDVGLATSPDGNAVFYNVSKLAFINHRYNFASGSYENTGYDYGFNITFVPWLRGIVNDVYFAYLSGYYNLKNKQTIASSIRFSSLGNIQFTDPQGELIREGNPLEFSWDVNYARRIGNHLGLGVGLRFIYSDLDIPSTNQLDNPKAAIAGAADISVFYTKPIKVKKMEGLEFNLGTAFTNIGSKITYGQNASSQSRDFLPQNFGLGLGVLMDINEYHELNVYTEVNKLLVPSPDSVDNDNNGIDDWREKSSIGAVFTSWGDAPTGFGEEMREFTISTGLEYLYRKRFAVRTGYFYEPVSKGNRRFLTVGAGANFSVVTLDFAYVIPTSAQRNPLDNTIRFSLNFDFKKGQKANNNTSTPTDL